VVAALWLWGKLYPLSLLDNQHYLTFIRIQNRSVRKVRLYGKIHSLPTLREYYKLISQNNQFRSRATRVTHSAPLSNFSIVKSSQITISQHSAHTLELWSNFRARKSGRIYQAPAHHVPDVCGGIVCEMAMTAAITASFPISQYTYQKNALEVIDTCIIMISKSSHLHCTH